MYRPRIVVVLVGAVAVLSMAGSGLAASGDIVLASTSDTWTKGNSSSFEPSLSADGTRVAFYSFATNLDPADTDTTLDIYVKDLTTGDVVLASTSDTGTKGNGSSERPSLSAEGTRVAFSSSATNLDPADTDSTQDVYVKDLTTGDVVLASTSDTGTKGNNFSSGPSLSADGTKVAFPSQATNLDPTDTDTLFDVYMKDLTTGNIVLASTSDAGTKGDNSTFGPSVSADGTKVALYSFATNLDPADTDSTQDVYVKDLTTGDISLASTSDTGTKGNGSSFEPSLSADGTGVAFHSFATNLDPADTNSGYDVYVKDLTTGDISLASTSDTGTKGNDISAWPSLSADGTTVAFHSFATNLDPADTDDIGDTYMKDLATGDIGLASTSDTGTKGDGYSESASLSADGTKVAFHSAATNYDPADSDGFLDIYVKDLTPPPSADLSLTKSDSPDPVAVGSDLHYDLTATNAGPSDATEVALTDELPSTVVFAKATGAPCTISGQNPDGTGGTVTCSLGSVSAGTSVTVGIDVSATASGSLTNTATVAGAEHDPSTADNEATATTTVTGTTCTMIGTQRTDGLTGTSGPDVICGLGGKDTIHGMEGADAVLGGSGDDTLLSGDAGNDLIQGGTGGDTLADTEGRDVLAGGVGGDSLNAQDGIGGDSVRGGKGTDTCTADAGDSVTGCP
jgi:uncharacterized repeat protein (TIGR01451 family)